MAILWEKRYDNYYYKVTQAGNAVRLYRNNVLHSQWNPKRPVSGKLWDLFLLTSLNIKKPICNVLVLGAGGGAIINLVHHFFPSAKIDAVDLDEMHIYVARKYFKVSKKYCNLFHQDAKLWIKDNKKDYDLIIDDVFFESNNIPYRSINAQVKWIEELLRRIKRNGVLVINYADNKEWNQTKQKKSLKQDFHIGVASHYQCDNKIVHITKNTIDTKTIKKSLIYFSNDYLRNWRNKIFSYKQIQ